MEIQHKIRALFLGKKTLKEIETILEVKFLNQENNEEDILNLKPKFEIKK